MYLFGGANILLHGYMRYSYVKNKVSLLDIPVFEVKAFFGGSLRTDSKGSGSLNL